LSNCSTGSNDFFVPVMGLASEMSVSKKLTLRGATRYCRFKMHSSHASAPIVSLSANITGTLSNR
jgi:hypothetical protein